MANAYIDYLKKRFSKITIEKRFLWVLFTFQLFTLNV